MHLTRVLLTGVVLAGLAACDSDPVSKEVAPEPFASVRWVNAVPDTVAMDYRIVDYPSNASEPNLAFRASSGNWRNLPPGPHHIRVFFTNTTEAGTDVSVVSQVFVDTTFVFEVGKKYTILHYGFAKAGASPKQRLILIPEELPSVASGNVALRSINAAPALGPVDVYAIATDTLVGAAVSGTPIAANLAPAGVSSWVNKPVVTTGSYRVAATAPSSTALLVEALAPVGAPAVPSTTVSGVVSQPLDAIAGTQQSQSAMTAVVFGPQVAYTLHTPTGGTVIKPGSTSARFSVLLDVHPPRISP